MRWRVLGAVEAVGRDERTIAIGSPNQRIVLATLLAHAGEVVSFDSLCEAVWGATPPDSAVTSLRTYVSRLRRVAGDALVTRGAGYVLETASDDVDAAVFDELVDAAADTAPGRAEVLLREALSLWRGPAFGAEAHLPGVRAEAVRLEERRGVARAMLARTLLELGRAGDSVAELEALLADEPYREAAWTLLVDALACDGRAVDALRAVQRASAALADAGLEPSAALRDAERRVLVSDGPPAPVPGRSPHPSAIPSASRSTQTTRPPHHASSFIGREQALEELAALLTRARLVTLVGPGGVGKSRLAAEIAHVARGSWGMQTAWADLSDLDDHASVADAVATAVGHSTLGAEALDVIGEIGAIDVLVVLDNAEHLVDAVARVVDAVLRGGARARVLVTSREPLDVEGEHIWRVDPLATTSSGPAIRLFTERARAVAPTIDLVSRADLVASVVSRLDGLPLAIEMAAARLTTTSLEELDRSLDVELADLEAARRGRHDRHHSLAAVVEWSERSLRPEDRAVLDAMSVFAGPVTGTDVEHVLDVDGALARVRELARRSLVTVDASSAPTRFGLLQVVRAHTARRLSADRRAVLERRHADHYRTVAAVLDRAIRSPDEADAMALLDRSFGELRAAHRWARASHPRLAAAMSADLHATARSRMLDEVFRWGDVLLDDPGDLGDELSDDSDATAALLAARAARHVARGELRTARDLAVHARDLATDPTVRLALAELLGDVGVFDGRTDDALAAYRAGVDLAAEIGDGYYHALHVTGCAVTHLYAGRPEQATAVMHGAVLGTGELGPTAQAWIHYGWGEIVAESSPAEALTRLDRAAQLAGAVRSRFVERMALVSSTALRARVGDVETSAEAFSRIITTWIDAGDRTHQLTTLRNLAVLLQRAGRPEAIAVLVGALRDAPVATYGDEARRLADAWQYAEERLGAERAAELAAGHRHDDVVETARWALDELAAMRRSTT